MPDQRRNPPVEMTAAEFLQQFKTALEYGPPPIWDEHERRDQEILDLGLDRRMVLGELRKLESEHLRRGPEPDEVDPKFSVVCIFRYPLDPKAGVEAYVKVALKRHPKRPKVQMVKIWSFKRWESF